MTRLALAIALLATPALAQQPQRDVPDHVTLSKKVFVNIYNMLNEMPRRVSDELLRAVEAEIAPQMVAVGQPAPTAPTAPPAAAPVTPVTPVTPK